MEITPTDMASAIGALQRFTDATVVLTLPKFKIEYNNDDVKSLMKKLGVEKIFKASENDFGNMLASNKVSSYAEAYPLQVAISHRLTLKINPNYRSFDRFDSQSSLYYSTLE